MELIELQLVIEMEFCSPSVYFPVNLYFSFITNLVQNPCLSFFSIGIN